jgi:hypothetical protein
LLHQIDAQRPAWPSPRSWVMANQLRAPICRLNPLLAPVLPGSLKLFVRFTRACLIWKSILDGKSKAKFPAEASARYATVLGLIVRTDTADKGVNG